jgi:hypothetical protein
LVEIDAKNWSSKAQKWIPVQNGVDDENMSGQKRAKLVDEGNLIYANIGCSASGKMSRILAQAESWHDEFGNLLVRSGVSAAPLTTDCPNRLVTLEEVNDAVESAASNVSLDLDEALALKDLGERIQRWQDRVLVAAPMRSRRVGKGKRQCNRYSVDDLISLIDEANTLPIQTEEDVERLREHVCFKNLMLLEVLIYTACHYHHRQQPFHHYSMAAVHEKIESIGNVLDIIKKLARCPCVL